MQKTNIETYIIAWNEAETIHLTIKHYQSFSKVILYDNFSDDRTREIAEEMGCEVRLFGRKGELNDAEYLKVKNRAWKGSKADFVILVDADEILWHNDLISILSNAVELGTTIFNVNGFDIYSNDMPVDSYQEIMTGFGNGNYSKKVIFNPQELTDINYSYGAHSCDPKGKINYYHEPLTLLHYRNIGGIKRLINRHRLYRNRMGYLNRTMKLGFHYLEDDAQKTKYFNEMLMKSSVYV